MRTPVPHRLDDGTTTWRVRFRMGTKQTSETFRNERDAVTFARILDATGTVDALKWLDGRRSSEVMSAITFAEYHEHYVTQLTGVTARTRDDYRSLRRRYLAELDPLPLPLITRGHVTSIVNRLDLEGKSPKTIRNVVHMLSSCLGLAIDEDLISKNPCRRIRLPAARHDAQEERFLTQPEFYALLAEIPEHYKPLVVFLVGTGLRWSEATALQARHVDLRKGTVRVLQAWKRVPGGFEIGPPKTDKGRRTVNAATLALLAVRPLLRKPNDWVFITETGKTISHSNFYNRIWAPAVDRSGITPAPRIHDLRHTHASWIISEGMMLESVQDQLGHESILTTRSVYGHLQPALGVAVGHAASEALSRALGHGPQPWLASLDRSLQPLALESADD